MHENSGPILSRLWTKVHEILQRCRGSLVLSNVFVRFLRRVSSRRYSPLSLEVVEKPNKCKSFLAPNFLRMTTPTFLRQIVSAIYCAPFGKVWLEFRLLIFVFKWQWSRKQNLRKVGKNGSPVWSRLWTKVHDISRRCRRPLIVVNALARLCLSCFLLKKHTLKVAVKLQSRRKKVVLGPRFAGGGYIPDFGHAFSNYANFWACGQFQ